MLSLSLACTQQNYTGRARDNIHILDLRACWPLPTYYRLLLPYDHLQKGERSDAGLHEGLKQQAVRERKSALLTKKTVFRPEKNSLGTRTQGTLLQAGLTTASKDRARVLLYRLDCGHIIQSDSRIAGMKGGEKERERE